jgi:UDP-N-acetylmuramoyl-tripeptide--D-alanyl-D-alanine ligase
MIAMTLSEAMRITGGTLHGQDGLFHGMSSDSRSIAPGMLFCALEGANFDGHRFIDAALRAGAAGALCQRVDSASAPAPGRIVVPDTLAAMAALVSQWRGRFAVQCIGITGSNGKTTVKEMLARIAAEDGPVLATHGNLNNEIGVPLTLARLAATHRFAVIEMGASHPGEIARLAAMAVPRVGVITQIAPAHLEGFGSVQGVAAAKGELLGALPPDGVAVTNARCAFDGLWRELAGHCARLSFGDTAAADVMVSHRSTDDGEQLRLRTPRGELEVLLRLPGAHNALNAAAATAAAQAAGIGDAAIVAGLAAMRPVAGRLAPLRGRGGARILDDSYNANPESLRAALQVLASRAAPRWLVLGDMAELGPEGEHLHEQAGRLAREAGVQRLYCSGSLSVATARAFGEGGHHLDDIEALIDVLRRTLPGDATVLVKGSRSAAMERVVQALRVEEVVPCC